MTKYSIDFKLKIVKEYLHGSKVMTLSKKYKMNSSSIFNWTQRYEKYGINGLKTRNSGYDYDGKFKLSVLEWKQKNQATYSQTALNFDISNPGTIANWQRKYDDYGVESLFNKRGHIQSDELENIKLEKLKRENRILLLENEYLKKLRALIQNEEQQEWKLIPFKN